MNLVQLQAEYQRKLQADTAALTEQVEIARLQAKLQSFDNPALLKAKVAATLNNTAASKLNDLNAACAAIVASMPIYSAKTRENRKWNPSQLYGFGSKINSLYMLLSGIQYAATEHKLQMLAITGLSETLIEQTLEAFGAPAYYSNNYGTIVAETPYDIVALRQNIMLLADTLDIYLDTSRITEQTMRARFDVAKLRAERQAAEAELTIAAGLGQTIKI